MPVIGEHCPYCGEPIELVADDSAGGQDYVEDCSVCCRPIHVRLSFDDDGQAQVRLSRDDDA